MVNTRSDFAGRKHSPAVCLYLALFWAAQVAGLCTAAEKPAFQSKVITTQTPGHAVDVDADLSGAEHLYLVVTDGGNGYGCDWADWAEPRLLGPHGEKRLTELKWKSASAGWGNVHVDKNADGRPMKIDGRDVAYGIGTHANSLVVYDLPPGFTRLEARAGLDNGGTDQAGGGSTSVQFHVYTRKPPPGVLLRLQQPDGPASREPEDAVAGLEVAEGLDVTLFASEPEIKSISSFDVDHRGRVWICEVVNYRDRRGTRPEGDRIVILEDTNGDGVSDQSKVFYQGTDVDSAHGVCVLGNRVIVTCSPNVFVFTDENGDDRPDRKELLFAKTGGEQNDHNTHAFRFGPDGKLYFNCGNGGNSVRDKDGNPIVDRAGNVVEANGRPYRQGMVFRCNPDGSDFETMAHNFRNDWEVSVDSFGTLWQSDNDDDGNRGCRILYLMEFGNYGYTDEMTGAGWNTPRTGMHPEIPYRHWHQNDPGVVPNLLQYGSGSPAGICVYEGDLLPEVFRGQIIHAEPGHNAVQAYPVARQGAGYTAEIEPILLGIVDRWFRPSDVCVAPDGSLLVADWYDPGVGGHAMGDVDRGRIFRVAPPDTPYRVPRFDFGSPDGATEALKNPNLAVRYLAWTALAKMGPGAEPALARLFRSSNPRWRARALWLLTAIEGRAERYLGEAVRDREEDVRVAALRVVHRLKLDPAPYVKRLVGDRSPQVRRQCAIALWHSASDEAPALWAELARQHDGRDRWYLEALGIGADGQWDAFFEAWLASVGGGWNSPAGRDIVWRSRAGAAFEHLAQIIRDPVTSLEELPRYFRALDFQPVAPREVALFELAFARHEGSTERRELIALETFKRMNSYSLGKNSRQADVLQKILDRVRGTTQFVDLVERFQVADRYDELAAIARDDPTGELGTRAVRLLLEKRHTKPVEEALRHHDVQVALATAAVLGNSADNRAVGLLLPLVDDQQRPIDLRGQAVQSLGKLRNGAEELIRRVEANRLDPRLSPYAAMTLHNAPWPEVRGRAGRLFPLPPAKSRDPLPPIAELLKLPADADRGKQAFENAGTCAKCHKVNGQGEEIGPDLSEIGAKLSREGLFQAVMYPSAGINFDYETYVIETEDGNLINGIITDESGDSITIKSADFVTRKIKKSDVVEKVKQTISLMPADVTNLLSARELADVVEYMSTLERAEAAGK